MTDTGVPQYFTWAATKTLSIVDVDLVRSNQHEVGGLAPLHRHLVDVGAMTGTDTEVSLKTVLVAVGYSDADIYERALFPAAVVEHVSSAYQVDGRSIDEVAA